MDASSEPSYPAHRTADVVLSDGGTVHLRPIRPSDADAVVAVHSRFSERTRYLRYFSPYPRIPQRDLDRFVTVDHLDREAFVVSLGDELIAIGRFDRLSADEAEVAFVVEDAHQGRGIGSVLLEHLASAAAENGIRRFVAEILPTNSRMMRVFTDAGYTTTRSYDDGVVHLGFDVAETPRSLDVSRRREQLTESRSIARLLSPRSVAVVGASDRTGTVGRALLDNLRSGEFAGTVYAVNPQHETLAGQRVFASVAEIPGGVDLVVVAVPGPAVPAVVRQCGASGAHALVVVSAGFAETGEVGRAAERALVESARAWGMRVVGPNCLGVVNTDPGVRLNASLAPVLPTAGRVGFFCQSGALGMTLLDQASQRGLGLSSMVSAGNRADVSGNDLLQFWKDDPRTDVVLLYLESFGNPRKFARVAREVSRRKPVVAVKSSTPPPGLAGAGPTVGVGGTEALFSQSGVIRVDTVTQLFDVAQILAYQPLPAGRTVAVVGNSAALGVLAVDACVAADLEVRGEPVDIGPDGTPADFGRALRSALADSAVHAVIVVFMPVLATPTADYARVVRSVAPEAGKPMVSTFLAAEGVPDQLRSLGPDGGTDRGSVPSYATPEAAAQALGAVADYAQWRRRPMGSLPERSDVDTETARSIVTAAIDHPDADAPTEGPRRLPDDETARVLSAYGIDVVPSTRCATEDEALAAAESYGFPVAVKAADDRLRNRVDLGAVQLDLAGPAELRSAYRRVAEVTTADVGDVLVQPMVRPGVGCLVEVTDDASFGLVVGFGLSGVATQLLGDVAWRAVPLTDVDAADLVRAPRAAPLLFGYRGAAAVDVDALADLVVRIGLLAEDLPDIRRLSTHPVLARPVGLSVLHASIEVASAGVRPDHGPRRLRR